MPAPKRPAEPIPVTGLRAGREVNPPFDARDLIGLKVGEGRELADRHGCRLRVLFDDSKFLDRTDDLRTHRINVAVLNDVIVEVLGVY